MERIMTGVWRILKRRAKIVVFICLFLSFSCFMMCSCSVDLSKLFGNWNPQGDWTYDLIGDYSIWRINGSTIGLVKVVDRELDIGHTLIDSYITCFSYNDRFIAVRKLDVPDGCSQEDILQMDFDQAQYFIVEIDPEMIYGPFSSETDFQARCDELGVGALGDWIPTYPAPEGAAF